MKKLVFALVILSLFIVSCLPAMPVIEPIDDGIPSDESSFQEKAGVVVAELEDGNYSANGTVTRIEDYSAGVVCYIVRSYTTTSIDCISKAETTLP